MLRILWNGKSGMAAQQEKLDAISNNIANVNTDGYKKVDVCFKDLVSESLDRKGYPVSEGKEPFTGTGVRAGNWSRNESQGNKQVTGIKSDLCINGEGYFGLVMSDGSRAYTRDGNFNIDSNGSIVDNMGNRLLITDIDGNNNINDPNSSLNVKFSKDNYNIMEDGTVSVKKEDNTFYDVGKVNIYSTVGQDSLKSSGNSMFVPSEGTTMLKGNGSSISQGSIELSNVNIAQEMTDMILAQRAFEFSSKSLKTADDMWGMVNSLKGR